MKKELRLSILLFILSLLLLTANGFLSLYYHDLASRTYDARPALLYNTCATLLFSLVLFGKFAVFCRSTAKSIKSLNYILLLIATAAFVISLYNTYLAISRSFIIILWTEGLAELLLYRYLKPRPPESPQA